MTPIAPTPPIVMTFAGADPSGGAGIQADLLTLASLGCHPLSVIAAITVQDTRSVESFLVMDPEWVSDQARFLLEDMPVAAFKVGMIGSADNVAVIASIAADYPDIPLILDPVLASDGGDPLADEELLEAIRDILLPLTTLITPNLPEARRLAATQPDEEDDLDQGTAAHRLLAAGAGAVLITGTHDNTIKVYNTLYTHNGIARRDSWARLPHRYHGSGCTLAAAIAGAMATGLPLSEAVREAQEYTWQTLRHSYRPGMGQSIPDRLFWARESTALTSTEATPADAGAPNTPPTAAR